MPRNIAFGDLHLNLNTRLGHFLDIAPLQYQAEQITELIQKFGPMQVVLEEPASHLGTPERAAFVVRKTLFECLHLQHKTDFIIIHGVKKACCRQWLFEGRGWWIQATYPLNAQVCARQVSCKGDKRD